MNSVVSVFVFKEELPAAGVNASVRRSEQVTLTDIKEMVFTNELS